MMGVSTRNTLLAGLAAISVLGLGGLASAGGGACGASGCGGSPSPVVPGPSVPVTGPAMPGSGAPGCCGSMPKGPNVIVPGVHVGGPHVTVTGPSVNVNQGKIGLGGNTILVAPQQAQSTTFLSGGGAFFAGPQGVAPSTLSGLDVSGDEERYMETVTEQVPVQEEVCVRPSHPQTVVRPIQAVCLDDTGTPHPASQVTGERSVAGNYQGEIYRCMAGTAMQVTVGSIENDQPNFEQAQSFSCQKGEALVRRANGQLACAIQSPERDCNERSLLRQYGPGLKLIQTTGSAQQCVRQVRTRMETRQRQVERVREPAPAGPIVLDGGVGQSVY
ncbi:MAG: hypothetical protein AAFQ22_03040 [Pseudomonadota bacterium]